MNKILNIFLIVMVVPMVAFANERIIIKYKPSSSQLQMLKSGNLSQMELNRQQMKPLSKNMISQLEQSIDGIKLIEVNQVGNGAHVLELQPVSYNVSSANTESPAPKPINIADVINKIKSDPRVEYVEVDRIKKPMAVSYNPIQWDMIQAVNGDNFQNLQNLWGTSVSSAVNPGDGVTVAVIDTGYTPHLNFLTNLESYNPAGGCSSLNGSGSPTCYGYTFISSCSMSNIPNCINGQYYPDGLDWGDWTIHSGSSWHGSHVTGTIVANGYTGGNTILGGAYGAKVVPVRALGSGGGYDDDIANAIYWAVNRYSPVANPNPAQVINLSLGGASPTCGNTLQTAINAAVSAGAIVVVAAGNAECVEGIAGICLAYDVYNVSNISPANCNNVISVSAKGNDNNLSWFSSYGNTTITASGGNKPITDGNESEVLSDVWNSESLYSYSAGAGYGWMEGTSQATPHVVATVVDLIAYFNLHHLSYSLPNVVSALQLSASKLNNNSNYNEYPVFAQGQGGRVSGLALNAESALNFVITNYSNKILSASPDTWSPSSLTSKSFSFTNESAQSVIISGSNVLATSGLTFTILSNSCANVALAQNESCSVVVGLTSYGIGSGLLRLIASNGTVLGAVPILVNNPTPPAPNGGGGGGSGGCSVVSGGDDASLIILLLSLSGFYYFFRRKRLLK